jgi:hypothetical protein
MSQNFPRYVQNFIANSFTSSTIRNMSAGGALERIQQFLKQDVDLADLSKVVPSHYGEELDKLTKKLQQSLPELDREKWGLARKCLNLFFRDALYNFYLRETYDLGKFEAELEIPLDSHVAAQLIRQDRTLPDWTTVIGLTREQSAKYQEAALKIANSQNTQRVHLDVVYWRGSKICDTIYVDLAVLKHIPEHRLGLLPNCFDGCLPEIGICTEDFAALLASDLGGIDGIIGPFELGPTNLTVK